MELAKVKEELKQKEKKNDQERRNRELQDIADSLKQYSSSIVEPNRSDLNSNNVGSKMLKKMGWQEGGGLGKARTGITAPIQVIILFLFARKYMCDSNDRKGGSENGKSRTWK